MRAVTFSGFFHGGNCLGATSMMAIAIFLGSNCLESNFPQEQLSLGGAIFLKCNLFEGQSSRGQSSGAGARGGDFPRGQFSEVQSFTEAIVWEQVSWEQLS